MSHKLWLVMAAVSFVGPDASAQQVAPVTTAEIPGPTGSADAPGRSGNVARPVFFGLLAFTFLAGAGYAALSDRKKARSQRVPRA